VGTSGAADPGGETRRTAAQDGDARGDERDLLSPADRLSLAVSAARPVSSALDGLYNIFRQFQRDGVWERIWEELHMALREALDREASPTAAILDSQSLKAAEKGEPRAGVKKTQWVTTPARR
jgi:transposase